MKRVFALVLGLSLLIVGPAMAAPAPVAVPKEEVVYAHLSSDGGANRVFVVNAFRETDGEIVDYGDYRNVVNLTDSLPITQNGARIEISPEPGDFYYQGELNNQEMPWLFDFEYLLDGRSVSAEELRGASGDLVIRIQVRKNEAVDPVFFENYMLQISVNLDSSYFSSIVSEGSTIATSGSTWVVNLTSLPGTEADFVINAVADNAHLGQIQIAGLPFAMMMELPDPAQYVSDLVALQDAIALLADGVGQFTSGVGQLGDAGSQLSSGATELADGALLISNGFDQLAAGRGEFDQGLRAYNQGVHDFAAGMEQLAGGIGEFSDGINQLATGSKQLADGLDTYSAGIAEFNDGLGQASDGSQQLASGVGELSDGLQQLTDQGKYADPNLVGGSAQILQALEMLDAALSFPLTEEELQLFLELVQTLADSLNEVAQIVDDTDFDEFMDLLRSSLDRFDDSVAGIEQIAASLQDSDAIASQLGIDVSGNAEAQALLVYMADQGRELQAQSTELRAIRAALAGLDPLIEGLLDALEQLRDEYDTVRDLIQRLNDSIQGITIDDLKELAAGIKLLSSNYRTFHEGLVAYVDGVEQAYLGVSGDPGLLSGAQDLSDGLGVLASASVDLTAGAVDLADGAGQLHAGILQLQDGVGQFAEQGGLIVDGANQLATGGDALIAGHSQLLAGDSQFGVGLWKFASGLGEYSYGISAFAQGLGALDSGGSELSDGANTLRDATSDMDQQMIDQMNDAMSSFLPSDFTLVSFADSRNTGIERVQFVYLIDAQTEQAPEPVEPEIVERSWWERIIDIFR